MEDRAAANAPELAAWEHTPYQGIQRAPSPKISMHQLHPEGQPGLEPAPHSTLEVNPHQIHDNNDKLSSYGPTSTTISSGASPLYPNYVLPQPYGYASSQRGNIGSVPGGGTSTVGAGSTAAGGIEKEAGDGQDGNDDKSKRYCFGLGTKRQVAWSLLAIGIFLIVVGVAVGVGVGVGAGKGGGGKKDDSSSPTPKSSTSLPAWTHTANLPPPTAVATITPSTSIICPTNNLTLYTPSNETTPTSSAAGKGYLLLCDRDYNSLVGAKEIANREADSMETCINRCAEAEGCVGAGWGNYEGKSICWLKSRLGKPGWTPGWYMAVREDAVLHDGTEGPLAGDTENG